MRNRKSGTAVLLTIALLAPFCTGCGDKKEFGAEGVANREEYIVPGLVVNFSRQGYTAQETVKRGVESVSSLPEENFSLLGKGEVTYSYNGTVFEYNGIAYEMRERYDGITAIMDCFPKGEYIIIENHAGLHNGVYSIFNTKTREFETDLFGHNLMFCGEDIHTAVYGFWNDICLYDGTVLATLDLGGGEIIREISFNKDEKQLEVRIQFDDNESYIETLNVSQYPELF